MDESFHQPCVAGACCGDGVEAADDCSCGDMSHDAVGVVNSKSISDERSIPLSALTEERCSKI